MELVLIFISLLYNVEISREFRNYLKLLFTKIRATPIKIKMWNRILRHLVLFH